MVMLFHTMDLGDPANQHPDAQPMDADKEHAARRRPTTRSAMSSIASSTDALPSTLDMSSDCATEWCCSPRYSHSASPSPRSERRSPQL